MRIEVYNDSLKNIWDQFVKNSKNGTFLFQRDYMDYHHDRFCDHSLLVWDSKDKLVALLPAHQKDEVFFSHGGLTYGGFITSAFIKTLQMVEVFDRTLIYLKQNSFTKFVYKTVPHIYHSAPAEEDRYALFLRNAALIKRNVLTVVSAKHRPPFQERRRRGVKKGQKNKLVVKFCNDFELYWPLLSSVLWDTYQAQPVHTLLEMKYLHSKFPNNIKLLACFDDTGMLAGVVIYETDRVARAQYIAASDRGKKMGALDLLFDFLLNEFYRQKSFFDFGDSHFQGSIYLNKGLIDQKEGFGARAVMLDHYEIDLTQLEFSIISSN